MRSIGTARPTRPRTARHVKGWAPDMNFRRKAPLQDAEDEVVHRARILQAQIASHSDHPPTIDEVEARKVRIRQGEHADLRPDAKQANRKHEQTKATPLELLDVRADERRAPDQLPLAVHPQPNSAAGATSIEDMISLPFVQPPLPPRL